MYLYCATFIKPGNQKKKLKGPLHEQFEAALTAKSHGQLAVTAKRSVELVALTASLKFSYLVSRFGLTQV